MVDDALQGALFGGDCSNGNLTSCFASHGFTPGNPFSQPIPSGDIVRYQLTQQGSNLVFSTITGNENTVTVVDGGAIFAQLSESQWDAWFVDEGTEAQAIALIESVTGLTVVDERQ